MNKIRPIFLLSFLIFLLSEPYEIFATNNNNILDLERSRKLLLDGYIQSDFDNHQLAIKYYTEAIRLNPNNFYAFLNRAFSRHQIKDNPGAWDDLNIIFLFIQGYLNIYFSKKLFLLLLKKLVFLFIHVCFFFTEKRI